VTPAPHRSTSRLRRIAPFVASALLGAAFVLASTRVLDLLPWEYDEGTFIVEARLILQGQRPFVDFIHHQPPLHLYLLALSGKVFGETLVGFRMLSVVSVAGSGVLLFALCRPFVGVFPALAAESVFLFSPSQMHALNAVAEGPMVFFTLLGVVLLFLGRRRVSTVASAVAFVVALLVKPTCLGVVVAAAASLAWSREWRRLIDLALSGIVAAAAAIAWTIVQTQGVYADLLSVQLRRLSGQSVDVFQIFSNEYGFGELRRIFGIETRGQWAMFGFRIFNFYPETYVPLALLLLSLLGVPLWVGKIARRRPALRAFAVLWPASYVVANFFVLPYVSSKYFVPFLSFSAFLLAAVLEVAQRYVGPTIAAAGWAPLGMFFVSIVTRHLDPWYYGRADWLVHQYPSLVSFSPMMFAATGTEPACGFVNPANSYGYGAQILLASDRMAKFRFSDERLIECLRANPETHFVVDFWFYYFTRPGSPLRDYLRGEGSSQQLFFSPEALEQWDNPYITKDFVTR